MVYQYGPVVVGVDGSPHSTGALRWAADEARRHTRTLVTVHVLPEDAVAPPDRDIAADAATEAKRWQVGVAAVGRTERGQPLAVLRRHAEQARLLVVGSRGAGEAKGRPLGSVSEALGARADCPVLIVQDAQRWSAPDAVLPRTGPVVVWFDGSDAARRAVPLAFEEAAGRGNRLVIVRFWEHPGLWRPGHICDTDLTAHETAVHDALRAAAEPWCARYPALDVEVRSEPGEAVDALTAVSQWSALMVLGTQCPDDRVPPTNPSLMCRVLKQAGCPILLAHGPSRTAAPRPEPAAVPA